MSTESIIDLRSDTVTKPTPEMRSAMANAEVGDDVYSEDPTINKLEARAAEIFGREASIFVPTGSMGNQIALRLHTQPGKEVVCESRAHVMDWEMGMAAMFSGCQLRTVAGQRGILRWKDIEPALATTGLYYKAQTGLIWVENTHNMAGGTVTPLSVMREVRDGAHDRGLPIHLDGARIFNAAAALETDVATLTEGYDSVNFCLSKGLCAPVGSLLVGTAEFIRQARMVRKALGGGMRQAGILAAAGLIALEEMPKRLHEDHATAKQLAQALAKIEGITINPADVETNIVIFTTTFDAPGYVAALKRRGVLASALSTHSVRLVTHRDVDAAACLRAGEILSTVALDTFAAA
ncbi:threonine aldolase family protein [Terriglobus roseus]|uniref:L-threonine aldolase n=1 Tax=Terriglobus roseus TaxID=392734 RepID=A0A1H4JF06_9BACT|nr:GntG family PLP-dependent aldolase [Terriglobus roseus]SEB44801.1 L-threonine aldolase [Terriglobus roseus]